jgi:hypothetical protein
VANPTSFTVLLPVDGLLDEAPLLVPPALEETPPVAPPLAVVLAPAVAPLWDALPVLAFDPATAPPVLRPPADVVVAEVPPPLRLLDSEAPAEPPAARELALLAPAVWLLEPPTEETAPPCPVEPPLAGTPAPLCSVAPPFTEVDWLAAEAPPATDPPRSGARVLELALPD